MKLLNVRLNADDARLADELRAKGVNVSDLVRQVIREQHERLLPKLKTGDELVAAVEAVHAKYPPHPDEPALPVVDAADRRQVQAYIRGHLMEQQRRIGRSHANHSRTRDGEK